MRMLTVNMKSSFKVCFFLHLLLLTTDFTSSLPDTVRIGGLFETDDDVLEVSFRYAIDRVNSNRNTLEKAKLVPVTEKVDPDDSFHASKKLCSVLKMGIAGIFGPRSPSSAAHVQSISDTLGIPHIEVRWDFKIARPAFSLNLYPHPTSLSKAYFDLVNDWKWKSFTLVYEDNQGLVRMQELLKADYRREVKMFVRQLEQKDDHRPLLKEMKKYGETRIILDCSADRLPAILSQAQEIGMMTHYHNYLITSLDLHTMDMEPFRNSHTNITAFRLIRPDKVADASFVNGWIFGPNYHSRTQVNNQPIKTEAALIYDAVFMFAKALNEVDRMNPKNPIDILPVLCNSTFTTLWPRGNDIIQQMKKMEVHGLTGKIKFDEDGFRRNFSLDITSYHDGKLIKIGSWTNGLGVNITRTHKEFDQDIEKAVRSQTFQVISKLSEPYTMKKHDAELYVGNDRFEGFSIDLLQEISDVLHFNYTIKLVKDNQYGSLDKETGEWNGMIKELIEQEADIAIGDLTINYDREDAVDFTMPFMNLGISILFKKPSKKDPNLFSFMSPLSLDVWLYMGTAYLAVSVLLFLLARFSPYEWDSPHPCDPDPDVLENQFNLLNCMWFTIGSLMQQGCDFLPKFTPSEWSNPHPCDPDPDHLENTFNLLNSMWFNIGSLMQQGSDLAPKAVSTRLVAGIWWFFTLIMISSYTANLAAFLTVERMVPLIQSVDDLAAQTKIKYGSMQGGTTKSFFRDSTLPTYQTMWSVMESAQPSVFTQDNLEGVDRVKKGDYAYLIESTANEYFVERNCELMQIGGLLDTKSYGIATPPGSPFRTLLSRTILKLQEGGRLHILKEKWWRQMRGGGKCPPEEKSTGSAANELGLENVGGVFVVLLGGMALACMVGVMEFVWKTKQTVREGRGSFWNEAQRELAFSLKCGTNKKPVNKKGESSDGLNVPLTNY